MSEFQRTSGRPGMLQTAEYALLVEGEFGAAERYRTASSKRDPLYGRS
jgi:hypothetical protein